MALTARNLCRMCGGGSSDEQIARKLAFTHAQDGSNRFKQAWTKYPLVEGSLNSKLPTIWRVEKQMKSR